MVSNDFMGIDGFRWFMGVVEDRHDPEKASRVRVRCFGYHDDDLEKIPTEDLPWESYVFRIAFITAIYDWGWGDETKEIYNNQ